MARKAVLASQLQLIFWICKVNSLVVRMLLHNSISIWATSQVLYTCNDIDLNRLPNAHYKGSRQRSRGNVNRPQ